MGRKTCEHEWTYVEGGPYNADEDAACYRDGFSYVPPGSYMLCSKCGKQKPAGDNTRRSDWRFFVALPFVAIYLIFIGVFGPLIIVIEAIYDELSSRKRAPGASR